jgi:HD-like signal output (HDOD) protein
MSGCIRILFVDDEPKILDGLRRMLRSRRKEWDMDFAPSGADALETLADDPRDVIVTDIRMPGMTGVELLEKVREQYPQTIRIALSGQASRETVLKAVGPTHQYLPKPCDADVLKETIDRICRLREMLSAETLAAEVAELEALPCLPESSRRLEELLAEDEPPVRSIGEVIARDVSMTAKILQMVSSGFFGPPRRVADAAQAATNLGLDVLRPLAADSRIFYPFHPGLVEEFALVDHWRHAVDVGRLARRIAGELSGDQAFADSAQLGGLLHDLGRIVLIHQLPETYRAVVSAPRRGRISQLDLETEQYGTTHAHVGAYLAGVWGLFDPIVEALAFHHHPEDCPRAGEVTPLTAVHVADALSREAAACLDHHIHAQLNESYLASLGLADRVAAWRSTHCQNVKPENHHD